MPGKQAFSLRVTRNGSNFPREIETAGWQSTKSLCKAENPALQGRRLESLLSIAQVSDIKTLKNNSINKLSD